MSGSAVAWEGPFEILNETFFDGDWSAVTQEYHLPPECGCMFPGTTWVITNVYRYWRGDEWEYRAYARYYGHCHEEEHTGAFGSTLCNGDGCWVHDLIGGSKFFVTDRVYNGQSNHTKELIDLYCGGVVPNNWQPFYGHPDDPYDVEVKSSGIIWGYIAIHFDKMSMIDGEYCIPNTDAVLIDSGSWYSLACAPKKDGWWMGVRSINDRTKYAIDDDVITARINVTVRWYYARHKDDGTTIYNNMVSVATFSDTKPMPTILSEPPNASATIVSQNNSVSPYSIIDVIIDEDIVSTEVIYKNRSSGYYNQVGELNSSDELKYFNFRREYPIWLPNQSNIVTRRSGYYIINEAPLSLGKLTINVSTPYQTQAISNYNVTVINSKPSDYIYWKVMFTFLATLGVFIMISYNLLRRFR